MNVFDLLPRGVLQGTVELLLMDRATQPESKELLEEVLRVIRETPAEDAVAVETGHWDSDQWCSRCGSNKAVVYKPENANRYCHSCGLKMYAKEDAPCG